MRSPRKKKDAASYAVTMRAKLPKAFRFGFTGTPIDKTMQNTHRDFGQFKDGVQERYVSYYGIRRSIKDGATLEVHYLRDKVPFQVNEKELSIGYERMCEEMELEDEEAKDFVQRKRAQWKNLATHPGRVGIIIEKMLTHFLAYPDPNGFKAQLVVVDRKACAIYGELAAKTRQLIQENTTFMDIAESLPVFKIDENYVAKLDDLPSPSDKAAALEAALTAELSEDDPGFIYRMLGERLQRLKERKDASDEATAKRLRELEEIAKEAARTKQEPDRLNLKQPGEYGLFTVLRVQAKAKDETYLAECARRMVAYLRSNSLLTPGWSNSIGGRMRIGQSLLAESWNAFYGQLGFDPESPDPPFLNPAVEELAKSD